MRFLIALMAITAFLAPHGAEACTTFMLDGPTGPVVGKSYDWRLGQGALVVHPPGQTKQALLASSSTPARWTSRYGSLAFHQYGAELPNGGLNEAGLVVEIMWLDAMKPEPKDARPAINELQWIQYQLDNFASVSEVLANLDRIRIERVHGKVHYLVCDKTGACAAIELLNGKMVATAPLPHRALTNHSYQTLAARLASGKPSRGRGSVARFVRAAQASVRPAESPIEDAFSVLENVRIPGYSQWWIVYDPTQLTVHFATRTASAVKTVHLPSVMTDCETGPRWFDIDRRAAGPAELAFTPIDPDQHRTWVRAAFRSVETQKAGQLIASVSGLGRTFRCAAPAP